LIAGDEKILRRRQKKEGGISLPIGPLGNRFASIPPGEIAKISRLDREQAQQK
jgi:hypothetical protein